MTDLSHEQHPHKSNGDSGDCGCAAAVLDNGQCDGCGRLVVQAHRSIGNAPAEVHERGGVALSLWLSGASETDTLIVAGLSRRCEELEAALDRMGPASYFAGIKRDAGEA